MPRRYRRSSIELFERRFDFRLHEAADHAADLLVLLAPFDHGPIMPATVWPVGIAATAGGDVPVPGL